MKILGALLLALTLSASAQLRETPIGVAPLGPAEGWQTAPVAASDGTDFFVVWSDNRGGTFGTRVTHDGRVLDTTGIFITSSQPRALLWCGGTYVLVYSAADNRSAGIVRFDGEGHIIDGPRNVTDSYVVAAATNGSTIVLAGAKITLLDDRGGFVEEIPTPFPGPFEWTVASNGSTYELGSVVYRANHNSVVATPLDAQGNAGKSFFYDASATQLLITPGASGYRVFFGNLQTDTIMTFDTSADPAPVSSLLGQVSAPAVVTTPGGYLLATEGASAAGLKIVRGSGATIVDLQSFVAASPSAIETEPAFASAGDNILFAWSENLFIDANVRAVILDGSGHPKTAPFDLTSSAPAQHSPAIATGGANDLVAWQEVSGVYASRIAPNGAPLDGRGIQLSTTSAPPQVIRDGDAYVVAWLDGAAEDLRWIDASSGTPIGGTVTVQIAGVSTYSLGRDDVGLVLFFSDSGHLQAQRVGMAGLIGPAVRLTPDSITAVGGNGVWNGHEWLVFWEETKPYPLPIGLPIFQMTVKAERVLDSLTVLDAQPLTIVDYPAGNAPATTNGDEFFIAWEDTAPGHVNGIYARTVSASGQVSDPKLLVAATDVSAKAAVWDGSHYAVAYAVRRDDAFYAFRLMLTHAGVGDELALSTGGPDQQEVVLAAPPGRPLRAAYTRVAPDPQYGYVTRLFTRDLVYSRRRIAPH